MSNRLFMMVGAISLAVSITACGSDTKKKSTKSTPTNNSWTNNTPTNNATNGSNNSTDITIDPTLCGDGTLDPGELCDPMIDEGPGACPISCETPACSIANLTGWADECTARCEVTPVACSNTEDGCCPLGCDSDSDPDCSNQCGNDMLEDGEVCDGNCPTTCNDNNACTTDTLTGSAASCSAQCSNSPVTACQSGDGCCPNGCTRATDSDCSASCGDNTVDANETCDGNCPTTCNDNNACTTDTLTGSAASCSAQCSNSPVTACQSGDGCCPNGCTSAVDNDCACVPTTSCAAQGLSCGTIFNGCQDVSCGSCGPSETCTNNICTPSISIGTACTSNNNCNGGECVIAADTGWGGGYCTRFCTLDNECGAGNHCGFRDPDNGNQGVCLKSCTTTAQCGRADYSCNDRDYNGVKECSPADGTGAVGSACSTIQQCSGTNGSSTCILPSGDWYQGYCSRSCSSDSDCGVGAHCSGYGLCLADSCSRTTGYAVYDRDQDGRAECFTAGTGTAQVGQPCLGVWECSGGAFALCIDEANSGLPGGYCSQFCGPGQATCAGDSVCLNIGVTDWVCADGCVTGANCRAGYTCADVLGDGNVACWL